MRFVSFLIPLLIGAPAWAQPGEHYPLDQSAAAPMIETLQKRLRSPSDGLKTLPHFQADIYARGLGRIADMAVTSDGAIYTTDPMTGRVFEIIDRAGDGRRDFQHAIINGLSAPSGLAVWEGQLFIADQDAVWVWDRQARKLSEFVSLRNKASGPHRPLLIREKSNTLWMALSRGGSSEIIAVDLTTRRAERVNQINGPISAMVASPGSDVWLAVDGRLQKTLWAEAAPISIAMEPRTRIDGLIMLGGNSVPKPFEKWSDHIFVAQAGVSKMDKTSSGGLNVIAVPTQFGSPKAEMTVWLDGFLSKNRRSFWGAPGPMQLDSRGLFLSDPVNGMIWRVYDAPMVKKPEPVLIQADTAAESETEKPPKALPKGSQITTASTLKVGSTIIRDWEAEQAKKKAEEAEEQP